MSACMYGWMDVCIILKYSALIESHFSSVVCVSTGSVKAELPFRKAACCYHHCLQKRQWIFIRASEAYK